MSLAPVIAREAGGAYYTLLLSCFARGQITLLVCLSSYTLSFKKCPKYGTEDRWILLHTDTS
jgi:hypothetical protein